MKTKPIPRPFPFLPSVASLPRLTRRRKDLLAEKSLLLISGVPLFVTGILIIALWVKTRPLLETQPLWQLLSGATWRPLKGEFGFLPFITGTLWVTATALVLAVPPCLLSAIYLAEYARLAIRTLMKPLLDLLAAIPSVVYGVWGLVAIVPWVQRYLAPQLGKWLGFIPIFALSNPTGFSVLSGGIVLAIMIVPFVIAVTYEVIQAVPAGVREASLAVGATRWQTVKYAVLPHVIPGVVAGIVLGASRALGETMAVLMVIGNVARSPNSIFDPAYPLTALIANNYGEMLSIPLYDSALMGAALLLLVIVLLFNLASTLVLRRMIRT